MLLVQLDLQVHQVNLVKLDLQGLEEILELLVHQASLETLARLAHRVHLDLRDLKANLAQLVSKELLVILDPRGHQVSLVPKVHQVTREILVYPDHLDLQDLEVQQGQQDLKVIKDHRVH